MISFIENKPVLEIGNQRVHEYDLSWLERAVDQALEKNNADNEMLSETICEAFDDYFSKQSIGVSVGIESVYKKLAAMLESIGFEHVIENIEWHSPGVTLDLLDYVENQADGFELGFIFDLSRDIQALQPFKHGYIDIANKKEAIQSIKGAKRWSPSCEKLSEEVDRWVNLIR